MGFVVMMHDVMAWRELANKAWSLSRLMVPEPRISRRWIAGHGGEGMPVHSE